MYTESATRMLSVHLKREGRSKQRQLFSVTAVPPDVYSHVTEEFKHHEVSRIKNFL